MRFSRLEDVEGRCRPLSTAGSSKGFPRLPAQQGDPSSTLPDPFMGMHAAVAALQLLTRDATRYRTYFPAVQLISPDKT